MEKEKEHTLTIGNQIIKYIGRIISVQGAYIDSGLNSNVLNQGHKLNNKSCYILLCILVIIYILSLYFNKLKLLQIISLVIPVAMGIILTKLWDIFKIWIGVIMLLVISLYYQSVINITQLIDLYRIFTQTH
jgi:hypothetical protein